MSNQKFKKLLSLFWIFYGAVLTVSHPQIVKAEKDIQSFDYLASLCNNWDAGVNNKNYEETLKACDAALAIKENQPELWLARGNLLLAFNKLPAAISSYQRMISLDANNSEGFTQLCLALSELGQYSQAINACEKALKINKNWGRTTSAVSWNYQGVALSKLGQKEAARNSFNWATKLNPDYSLAWTNTCVYLYEIGEFKTALNACDRALEANQFWGSSNAALGWANRGKVTQAMGLYDESLMAYNKAIAFNNNDRKIWTEYGILLTKLGKYPQAQTALETAIKISPNYALALVSQCTNLNRMGKYEEAAVACDTALQKSDNIWGPEGIASAWNQFGNALVGLKKYDESLAAFNRAISLNSTYASAWSNRSVALWHQGKYQEALVSNERALEIDIKSSQAWYNKGRIYTSLGQLEAATAAYERALKGDGYIGDKTLLAEVWVNQSSTLLRLQRYQEAITAANNAIGFNPQASEAFYNKALGFMALKKYNQAVTSYERAIKINPKNADFWAGKGIALRLLKKYPEASEALKEALKINPNHPQALDNQDTISKKLQQVRGL
ncbi:tetratricopeptide repeat protein [Anabaena sp. FACHB-1237]|uniref:tetratricopeptide repeat protein n=1 Tax=Anabaena sp. FACHB-1237 TaxID=2692769 RepID=UPI00168117E6|nr:tetratricopeptide repeat protein [Anabaena sp. FACHB-1237]MBD2138000.1 tetratricopeptide repeat protein [Anabaena sp. FACHB-1237]